MGGRAVVKADGLAAGKGVTVCDDLPTAEAAVRAAMLDGVFGEAGRRVVIEEVLTGQEVSVSARHDSTLGAACVVCAVRDQGPGFRDEDVQRIRAKLKAARTRGSRRS